LKQLGVGLDELPVRSQRVGFVDHVEEAPAEEDFSDFVCMRQALQSRVHEATVANVLKAYKAFFEFYHGINWNHF
jgi:hypothetical protein